MKAWRMLVRGGGFYSMVERCCYWICIWIREKKEGGFLVVSEF